MVDPSEVTSPRPPLSRGDADRAGASPGPWSLDALCIDRLVAQARQVNQQQAAMLVDMLDYVDRGQAAGERLGGVAVGGLERDAAYHELSLARRLPVKTITDEICRARRLRATMPQTWQAVLAGDLSPWQATLVDGASTRLQTGQARADLDDAATAAAAHGSYLAAPATPSRPASAWAPSSLRSDVVT